MNSSSLNRDDVVNVDIGRTFVGATTFTVEEMAVTLAKLISEKMKATSDFGNKWGQDGVPARVLQTNGKGWAKGKVRISLEFIPDEPTPSPTDAVLGTQTEPNF